MDEKTVNDYHRELQNELIKMRDEIENRKKIFGRGYLKHVGNFLKMIDSFLRKLERTVNSLPDTPKEDLRLIFEPEARIIKENFFALICKSEHGDKKEDLVIETIILDIATSINYYECLPLVVSSKDIESAKAYPLILKRERDPQDPVIILVNPKIVNNLLLTPLIGHEVAHLLEKSHRAERDKNYTEELCCDYLASIIFGVSYIKAQLMHVSGMTDDQLYNMYEPIHPPREYRISEAINYLNKIVNEKIDKQIKKALLKVNDEWKDRKRNSKPPRNYDSHLSSIDIDSTNKKSHERVSSIIKQYNININLLIHNKHPTECPLSLIYKNSIYYLITGKEDKTIKSKILDYSKKLA